MQTEQENDPYLKLLFEEAALLLKRAEEAGPDNADPAHVARAFDRLIEGAHRHFYPDNQPDFDMGAVAQTAATRFAVSHQHWFLAQTAQLMGKCLQRALEEEGRKIEFPVYNYDAMPEPDESELDDYGSGYDPLALHKFTQCVITKGVLRVRGDDDEILRAILELNEAQFLKASTREEFIENLAHMPAETKDYQIACLDSELSALPDQTPEAVAQLLRQYVERVVLEYSQATHQGFMSLGDHGIRCGIAATLFAAAHYSSSIHAEASGAPQEVIEKARPRLTDLKKEVADYFADWLIKPLATRPRPGKKRKADLSQLAEFYDGIVDTWRDAYDVCHSTLNLRQASARAAWREVIKQKFPSFSFPDDLIERLQPPAYWPEQVAAIHEDKGGDDNPEDIALLHAARLCGADDYSYKLSSLRKTYNKQKRGI